MCVCVCIRVKGPHFGTLALCSAKIGEKIFYLCFESSGLSFGTLLFTALK